MLEFIGGLLVGFLLGAFVAIYLTTDVNNYVPNPSVPDQHTHSSPRDNKSDIDEFLDRELGRGKHNTSTMWGDD